MCVGVLFVSMPRFLCVSVSARLARCVVRIVPARVGMCAGDVVVIGSAAPTSPLLQRVGQWGRCGCVVSASQGVCVVRLFDEAMGCCYCVTVDAECVFPVEAMYGTPVASLHEVRFITSKLRVVSSRVV